MEREDLSNSERKTSTVVPLSEFSPIKISSLSMIRKENTCYESNFKRSQLSKDNINDDVDNKVKVLIAPYNKKELLNYKYMDFDLEMKNSPNPNLTLDVQSLNYWKKITDFVLKEEQESFKLTLKAIKRNYDHIKLQKLQNILKKKKRKKFKSNRRISVIKPIRIKKNSLLGMVIPKSGRRFANSISLKSQYFNMWSPKKRGIPSNTSFAADMDDTFTEICEGESSVSKNSQNSQPSSRKKETINDLPNQQRKLLELAREKYSRFTRKCNKQKKTKFRSKSKFQKQFKEFDKMSAIRYPTLNNTKMNNGFHNNIPQFRRCTKEEHASFLCDLPKLDISTTPIKLKSKSRAQKSKLLRSLDERDHRVLTSCGMVKKKDLFTNQSHQNYLNNRLIMEKFKPLVEIPTPAVTPFQGSSLCNRRRRCGAKNKVVYQTNLCPFGGKSGFRYS
ncbi:unnamed protein product [Moneuplotes crassus]|uniref:Uncharacterized protein n=1 Tax=Euplotes crassus TaxID=5936 RepID=A0AAD1XE67_EUPCR|nr:unnamed protein product [Moneuplotes crassus]